MTYVLFTLPAPTAARRQARPGSIATVAGGLVVGAAVGVVLRAWMRLVSDEPEFSWGGSLFIVGAFTILGTSAGVVAAGRRRGWRGSLVAARAVGLVLGLACFGGAGVVMLVSVVPGALAAGRHDWPRVVRIVLGAVAAAATVGIGLGLVEVPLTTRLAALPLFAAGALVEVRLFAELVAPSVARLPSLVRWFLWAVPVLMVASMVLAAVGA